VLWLFFTIVILAEFAAPQCKLEMAQTENLCPPSALHQQLLSAVRTAFVVHYPVRIRATPQSQITP